MAKKYIVTVNGTSYEVVVEDADPNATYTKAPEPAQEAPKAAPAAAPAAAGNGEKVTSPLPGTVLKVLAKQGAAVKSGDVLCIIEAMKMENEIMPPATERFPPFRSARAHRSTPATRSSSFPEKYTGKRNELKRSDTPNGRLV